MDFERIDYDNEISTMSGCSGCSNKGKEAYSGNYSSQANTNRGDCSSNSL